MCKKRCEIKTRWDAFHIDSNGNENEFTWGECGDIDSTGRIVFARYSYDIDDHCVSCNFADGDTGNKAYWPKRPITCIDGRWR